MDIIYARYVSFEFVNNTYLVMFLITKQCLERHVIWRFKPSQKSTSLNNPIRIDKKKSPERK